MWKNKFIQSFTKAPKELFRVNLGTVVRLRAYPGPVAPQRDYDLLTDAGNVRPLTLDPATYEFPNGASMYPNTSTLQTLVRTLEGPSVHVFSLPNNTSLPDDLILVHEFKDRYSLQARKQMTVEDLDAKITEFLSEQGVLLTKEEWLVMYPRATE